MKFKYLLILIFLIFFNSICKGANYKTILLKNINNEYDSIPIENHRIITFTNNNICFSSNYDIDSEISAQFSLNEYRHISFTKDEISGIIYIKDKKYNQPQLSFDHISNKIVLSSTYNPQQYTLGLFSVTGKLLFSTNFDENGESYLPSLEIGTYVVTAIYEKCTISLKLIIK